MKSRQRSRAAGFLLSNVQTPSVVSSWCSIGACKAELSCHHATDKKCQASDPIGRIEPDRVHLAAEWRWAENRPASCRTGLVQWNDHVKAARFKLTKKGAGLPVALCKSHLIIMCPVWMKRPASLREVRHPRLRGQAAIGPSGSVDIFAPLTRRTRSKSDASRRRSIGAPAFCRTWI